MHSVHLSELAILEDTAIGADNSTGFEGNVEVGDNKVYRYISIEMYR